MRDARVSGHATVVAEGATTDLDLSFTPSYGAPEQFSPDHGTTGPWTDEYALALVFVELVTGREALGSGSIRELAMRSCDPAVRPTPQGIGRPVDPLVERTLSKALSLRPDERFRHVGDFWSALKGAAPSPWADMSGTIPIPLRRPRAQSSWRRLWSPTSWGKPSERA